MTICDLMTICEDAFNTDIVVIESNYNEVLFEGEYQYMPTKYLDLIIENWNLISNKLYLTCLCWFTKEEDI